MIRIYYTTVADASVIADASDVATVADASVVADASDVAKSAEFEDLLPAWRKDRICAVSNPRERMLSLCVSLLLSFALSKEGVDFRRTKVIYNRYGKPYLAGNDGIFFSLSHSSEICMCAIADAETGCDVQRIKDLTTESVKRMFTENERKYIEKQKDPRSEYIRFWTMKESYVKMTGTGFSVHPWKYYEVVPSSNPFVREKNDSNANKRHVFFEYGSPEYRFAVCLNNGSEKTIPELMKIEI